MMRAACIPAQLTYQSVSVWRTKDFNEWTFFNLDFFSDAPIVASMPHFLNADERYGLMVDGLNPIPEKHNIFIDLEPYTGVPLRGGKKLQFNMFLKKIDRISKK